MAIFEYRCASHGGREVHRPVGTAPPTVDCPSCGQPARRVFAPPLITHTPRALRAARDRAEATRETPAVVTSLPPRRRRPAPPVPPAAARLPRP